MFLVVGLGLDHFCPLPQKGLSSEGLSMALDFFVFLALVSSLVSSTSPLSTNFTAFYNSEHALSHRKFTIILIYRFFRN